MGFVKNKKLLSITFGLILKMETANSFPFADQYYIALMYTSSFQVMIVTRTESVFSEVHTLITPSVVSRAVLVATTYLPMAQLCLDHLVSSMVVDLNVMLFL